jgi:hypothetical protein
MITIPSRSLKPTVGTLQRGEQDRIGFEGICAIAARYLFDPLCKIKIAPHACAARLTFVEECDGV